MVTILANDDAAGFIYLESTDLLTLDEPSNEDLGVTTADIVIQRGPGMYGVVNVPYEIIPELEENRNDLSPMQGSITMDNKQVKTFSLTGKLSKVINRDATVMLLLSGIMTYM